MWTHHSITCTKPFQKEGGHSLFIRNTPMSTRSLLILPCVYRLFWLGRHTSPVVLSSSVPTVQSVSKQGAERVTHWNTKWDGTGSVLYAS